MATQSLYRRYRPRRFSELKGQDHIVRALRTSVAEGREGQAYLFSGPRGTGKTTTARIMAKVLNCQNPAEGEPCCECESCLSVEAGTSYDVHELDAASNNGVDAMRDLIEKASLGTPGRHKVYILDEVHMLSKGAEAALLKTLEEPPPHVVFVLATTDPQKMSDTIRSRTQHLQFHLLAPDTLQEHVRWVADDAGLTVTDEAIEQVIAQGAGSPRDTLSALELVSNSGGAAVEVIALDEFVEAMIDNDPGRALKMVAHAISRGRDPRTVTEELIAFFRNGFLALMAPDLVQLPSQRIEALTDLARRLGAAGLVRGIETLGAALTEMRQAPDPRVLLDVATVQLTSEQVGATDIAALVARIQKLERKVAEGVPVAAAPTPAANPVAGADVPAPPAAPGSVAPAKEPAAGRAKLGARAGAAAATPPVASTPPPRAADPAPSAEPQPAPQTAPEKPAAAPAPAATSPVAEPASPAPAAVAAPSGGAQISSADWDTVRPLLRGMARAMYSPATHVASGPGHVTLGLPNEPHRAKCEQHRSAVEAALTEHAGASIAVELVVQSGGGDGRGAREGDGGGDGGGNGGGAGPVPNPAPDPVAASAPAGASQRAAEPTVDPGPSMSGALAHDMAPAPEVQVEPAYLSVVAPDEPSPPESPEPVDAIDDAAHPAGAASESVPVRSGREIAELARRQGPAPDPEASYQTHAESLPSEDEIDLDDLVDAPPEAVKTPVDRLAEAFPGSELVDDIY